MATRPSSLDRPEYDQRAFRRSTAAYPRGVPDPVLTGRTYDDAVRRLDDADRRGGDDALQELVALAGLGVVLLDSRAEALDKAVAGMASNMDRQVAKGAITAEAKATALGQVSTTTDYAAFAEADLVIEAATEKEEVKRAIFRALTVLRQLALDPSLVSEEHAGLATSAKISSLVEQLKGGLDAPICLT